MRRLPDKAIGYLTILAAMLLCTLVAWKMYLANGRGAQTVEVVFSDLGSLQPQDDVMERGFRVGHVRSAGLVGDRAVATIDFDTPVRYCEGTRFINSNYSLMGQRYIVIIPSHEGRPLDLSRPQEGEFEPGIAEAMHMVAEATAALDSAKTAIELIANGNGSEPGFAARFNGLVSELQTALDGLDRAITEKGALLRGGLEEANGLTARAAEKTGELDAALDTTVAAARTAVASLAKTVVAARAAMGNAMTGLDSLSRTRAWKRLAESRELYDALASLNDDLRKAVDLLAGNGGERSMKFGKVFKRTNWNVFGATAREKRAKRAENGETAP